MSNSILDRVFPAGPQHQRHRRVATGVAAPEGIARADSGQHKRSIEALKTKWTAVYTLELRGFTQKQIAEALGMSAQQISNITLDSRYIEYREQHLSTLDQEFVAMKPLAFRALRGGLSSPDENTALRASEQWFKAANYGGFSKHERPAVTTSAEDIARSLLNQVNIQVNVHAPGTTVTATDGATVDGAESSES